MGLTLCHQCRKEISTDSPCPHCGAAWSTVVKKTSFAGGGCALQGLGLASWVIALVTFFTVNGPIFFGALGLWLIMYGSGKAGWFECSRCGYKLANKKV